MKILHFLSILHFIYHETMISKKRIFLLSVISGLSGGLLLVIINFAVAQVYNQTVEVQLLLIYLIVFLLQIYTQHRTQHLTVSAIETSFKNIRLRIVDKLRRANLHFIEQNSKVSLYTALSQSSHIITQSVIALVLSIESLLLLGFTSLYLAWLSPIVFLITVTSIAFLCLVYVFDYDKTRRELEQSSEKESEMFDYVALLLKNFKVLKINQPQNNALFHQMEKLAEKNKHLRISANKRLLDNVLYANVIVYVLLFISVFILPFFIIEHSEIIYKITATLLFMMGSLGVFASTIPSLTKGDSAINSLYRLETQINEAMKSSGEINKNPMTSFHEIHLKNAVYHYPTSQNSASFSLHVVNFKLTQGEIIFITGANGSGKTTLLNVLIGLYPLNQGTLSLNQQQMNEKSDMTAYQHLFSLLPNDLHLSHLSSFDEKKVNFWLKKLALNKKIRYLDHDLNELNLSLGEKRRLALLIAILQKKSICILDDFINHQDIEFRRVFYTEILTILQAAGHTILLITYDIQYFHHCDKLLTLQHGHIIQKM